MNTVHEDGETDEHDHEELHSEVRAEYRWHCANASQLVAVQPLFIAEFESVESIEIQIITAGGVARRRSRPIDQIDFHWWLT